MRVVKATQYLLRSPTFVTSDGETPADCTSTAVAAVVNGAGTTLTAPTVATAGSGTGQYDATLTAATHTAAIDKLTVTWTGTTTTGGLQTYVQEVDVVGGHVVTLAELRAEPNMSEPAMVPKRLLEELRDEFTTLAEDYCSRAFVRSYQRDTLPGNGTRRLVLTKMQPRTVTAVTVDGTAKTATDYSVTPEGFVVCENDAFPLPPADTPLNCIVAYEYGPDATPPGIARAAKVWIRRRALARSAKTPSDAISETVDGVQVRFSTPDWERGRPTGMLDVDAALNAAGRGLPAIA